MLYDSRWERIPETQRLPVFTLCLIFLIVGLFAATIGGYLLFSLWLSGVIATLYFFRRDIQAAARAVWTRIARNPIVSQF